MAKPRRGRPPLGDLARTVAKLIRLTPAEAASWRELAERQGITLVQLIRESVELAIARGASR